VATKAQAVARLDDGSRHMVAFLNAHAANLAWRDRAFAQGLERFLVLNDGFGIDLASRFHYGRAFPDNLNGTDFLPDYLAATRHRFRIFLLGARPEVVADAAAALTERFPQHQVVGWRDGYFDLSAEGAIAEQIRRSGADLLLVGMGVPRQELWLARNFEETGCRLGFAVGALFDFLSGRVRRAPLWLRGLRAEWLFRLCLEPRRLWRRYVIGNALFLLRVGRMTAAGRRTE